MTGRKKLFTLIAVFVATFALLSTSAVQAQTATGGGQALEIGPPVVSINGDPGQTITTNLSLRDVSSTDLYVTGQVNDFIASGEDGTPKVILDDTTTPYSFKEWVRVVPSSTLKPKQIKTITVTIDIPKNASPGGYYGIVRFSGVPPELKGSGVSLNASLGSLIFLKVNGQAKEQLSIEEFSVNSGGKASSIVQGAPITVVQRIKNTGNTFEQPVGLVTITDMFGKTVATLPVNEAKRLILSDSTRRFEEKLDTSVIGDKILFGKYNAEFTMSYGSDAKEIKQTISFWVIPYTLIGVAIIVLVMAFFLFRYLIRRYNRLIVSRATGSSTKQQNKSKTTRRRRK
ncbi:MAG: hypothetical protein ABIP50_01090 [Candidatus Saccharimonadales bacterium]